jgi:hypoxia up-regulated 1
MEDWLYEDGANANYTTYDKQRKNMTDLFDTLNNRKVQHAERDTVASTADKGLEAYEAKIEDLKTTKTWITDEERQDVTDKIAEIRNWLKEQLEAQAQLKLSEDPVFQSADLMKKMAQLKKLYTKVANKKKPKPPKDEKSEEKAEEKEEEKSEEEPKTEGTEDL